ncbi:SH3 domain-containing protein [Lasiosphaeria miniovina]|uniref:SH3 domain-containing protein n=1 Tax=Lasiosphaeria miniovina TaxID=1954250 RepID=A0AA39ZTZ1_9PEZI|nr:SH3 domain-containing protein [Lasiosphaeria miniovina]KAK0703479.1 SH3 domain-containing protein [Lasiosphaeria miniovina]
MVSEDRQRVIETNRSLRLIKNELEALLEKGVISDTAFDSIHSLLPTEASISGAPAPALRGGAGGVASAPPPPPTAALNNLHLEQASSPVPPPPSYNQSTGGPPPLPGRRQPPPPPSKPVLTHARALFRYEASDARDCSFERDDRVAVYEYMNADWWMGRNLRTGQEGIFPKSYVEPETAAASPVPQPWNSNPSNNSWDEKNGAAGGYPGAMPYQPPAQPQYVTGGMLPPPAPGQFSNPYNGSAPPPMAIADGQQGQQGQQGEESGVSKHGKKIGKKLGNAAIFGAGATIGSNLVNSIF